MARDEVQVTPYRDGPILVRGPIKLTDADGVPLKAPRKVIAICRCGESSLRPYCDGSHKTNGFTAPGRDGRVACSRAHEAPSEE